MEKQRYTTQALLTGALMLAGAQATQAATITADTSLVDHLGVGETVTLFLIGTGFTEGDGGSLGGGINISWTPSMLTIADFDDDVTLLFPGTENPDALGNLSDKGDNSQSGFLKNLSVVNFSGTEATSFVIASIRFTAVGAGTTDIDIELGAFSGGKDNIWVDAPGASRVDPVFVDGIVTVEPIVVPLPAAAWFFVSGFLGLAALGRRRILGA